MTGVYHPEKDTAIDALGGMSKDISELMAKNIKQTEIKIEEKFSKRIEALE